MGAAMCVPLPEGRLAPREKRSAVPDLSARSQSAMEWLDAHEEAQVAAAKKEARAAALARAAAGAAGETPTNEVLTEVVRKLSDPKNRKKKPSQPDSLRAAVETWITRVNASSEAEARRSAPSPPDTDRTEAEMKRVRSLAKYLLVDEPEKALVALAAAATATRAPLDNKEALAVPEKDHRAPMPEEDTPVGSLQSVTTASNSNSTSTPEPPAVAAAPVPVAEVAAAVVSPTPPPVAAAPVVADVPDDESDVTVEDVPPVVALELRAARRAAEQWRSTAAKAAAQKPSLAHLRATPRDARLAAGGASPTRWGRVRIAFGFTPPGSARDGPEPVRRTKTPASALVRVAHVPSSRSLSSIGTSASAGCAPKRAGSFSGAAARKLTPWA